MITKLATVVLGRKFLDSYAYQSVNGVRGFLLFRSRYVRIIFFPENNDITVRHNSSKAYFMSSPLRMERIKSIIQAMSDRDIYRIR